MKFIASFIFLGISILAFAYFALIVGFTIYDNMRTRAAEPIKIYPILFVPDFIGCGSFMTTGWAFLTGTLGFGLLLFACSLHLRWTAMYSASQTESKSAEQAIPPKDR